MTDREKRWFIYLEIESRKSKPKPVTKEKEPVPVLRITPTKTSTPIRKTVKPGMILNPFKKRIASGGSSRKL